MTCLAGIMKAKAGPVSISETETLKIIYEEKVADGVLEFYGGPASKNRSVSLPLLSPQCGSNRVTCDGGNTAPSSVCRSLINALRSSGNERLRRSPRSICLDQGTSRCCTSWANDALSSTRSHLVNAAEQMLNACGSRGWVSGYTYDTLLGSTCTKQCLSNRPDGC
jgi:hypothetical protein